MTMVIAGFPGVGKTTATNLLKEKGIAVLDSDSSKFDKQYFPTNYIKHIQSVLDEGKTDIIFVSTHAEVLSAMQEANIEFAIVYPDVNLKEIYLERYRKRNTPQALIDKIDENWFDWIISLKEKQKQYSWKSVVFMHQNHNMMHAIRLLCTEMWEKLFLV